MLRYAADALIFVVGYVVLGRYLGRHIDRSLGQKFQRWEEVMGVFSDKLDAAILGSDNNIAGVQAALDRVGHDFNLLKDSNDQLTKEVNDLKALIAENGGSPEDQAKLDQLLAKQKTVDAMLAALDANNSATIADIPKAGDTPAPVDSGTQPDPATEADEAPTDLNEDTGRMEPKKRSHHKQS